MYFQSVTQFFQGKVQTQNVKKVIIHMIFNKIHKTKKKTESVFFLCPRQGSNLHVLANTGP